MTMNTFVWNDLSSYEPAKARRDYANLFGWSFSGGDDYAFASVDNRLVAAVFQMPEKFIEIKMPSFWMSYIRVDDLEGTVEKARAHEKAIIEVEPQAFNGDARIALVRDPSGAGFTLYEGPEIDRAANVPGAVAHIYHHVPDVALIEPFYRDLFDWSFVETPNEKWRSFAVKTNSGEHVATVEEVPDEIRGKFRYWMPSFFVDDIDTATTNLDQLGGSVFSDLGNGRVIAADRQGAHFMIEPSASGDTKPAPLPGSGHTTFPWRAGLGLLCIWLAVVLDFQPFWGVLFLIWTWPALRTGQVHFIDSVMRARNPILYWGLVGTWIFLSLWLIFAPLLS